MNKYFAANATLSMFAKNYMELKKGLPIRPSEMAVLNIITETDGPHTPVMLAELLDVSKPMITAHIASLKEKGYITKKPCALDKRAYYILPTDKAKDLVEKAKTDMNANLERLISSIGRKEFDELVRLTGLANEILARKGE